MERAILLAALALLLTGATLLARREGPRLLRPLHRVDASVIGHGESWEDGQPCYAPTYAFTSADGAAHEVTDTVYTPAKRPPLGTVLALSYPTGRPDLARPARPWLMAAVWLFLAYSIAMVVMQLLR